MARTAAKPTTMNALEMLMQDHKNVQKLFRKFKRVKESEEKEEVVQLACEELTTHSAIEEEIFYPAVREAAQLDDLLNEAEVEHSVASDLIEQLQNMSPDDELYDATFTVLSEYITHHVEEEEQKLFPKVKRAKLDLAELGNQMQERRQEMAGVDEEDEEDIEDDDSGMEEDEDEEAA